MTEDQPEYCCRWHYDTEMDENGYCPECGARIRVGDATTEIYVFGRDSAEVAQVARQLAEDESARREVRVLRSPWISGLFYLVCVVTVIALILVVGSVLPLWTLPIVVIGAVIIVAVVGAFQLRQDDRLSERGFLTLMRDTLRHLPKAAKEPNGNQDPRG